MMINHEDNNIHKAYNGVPVCLIPNNIVGWDEVAPNIGQVDATTSLLEYCDNDPSAPPQIFYSEEKFFDELYELAVARQATMIKNAQKLYEDVAAAEFLVFPTKAEKKLTLAEKKALVEALLIDTGVINWDKDIRKHALALAAAAEIPIEHVELTDTKTGTRHYLLAYNANGKALNASEQKEFERQCELLENWLSDEVYDLRFPAAPDGELQAWNVVFKSSVALSKKSVTYEFLDELRKDIDRLVAQTKGTHTVILPYAQPHSRDNNRVEFSARKKIKIKVKSHAAACALQTYWARFGDLKNSKIIAGGHNEQ